MNPIRVMFEGGILEKIRVHLWWAYPAKLGTPYGYGVIGLLSLIVLLSGQIAGDGSYSIEGHVRNGSGNSGMLLSGLEVTLHEVGLGTQGSTVVLTDEVGSYRFENLQLLPGIAYGISVEHKGVLYGRDIELPDAFTTPIQMTVFDVTDNIDVISFESISVLFADVDRKSQRIAVLESVILENRSDMTYVPGRDPMSIVRFSLPPDSDDLSVSTDLLGTDVFQVDLGFGVTSSVPPGKHEILYSYSFPYQDSAYKFEKRILYGAATLRVMWDSELFDLVFDSGTQLDSVDLGTRSYDLSESVELGRGADISLSLLKLPKASTLDRFAGYLSTIPLQYLPPVAVAVVLLAVVPLIVFRRRRKVA